MKGINHFCTYTSSGVENVILESAAQSTLHRIAFVSLSGQPKASSWTLIES